MPARAKAAAPARTRGKAAKPAPPPEPEEDDLPDLTGYATKAITETIQEFADWLKERTGYTKVDLRSVALAGTLRQQFQKEMREQGSPRARGQRTADEDVDEEEVDEEVGEEEEEEEEPAPPPRRTRASTSRAKAAANGKGSAAKAATSRPARRGRATPSAEAPY